MIAAKRFSSGGIVGLSVARSQRKVSGYTQGLAGALELRGLVMSFSQAVREDVLDGTLAVIPNAGERGDFGLGSLLNSDNCVLFSKQ